MPPEPHDPPGRGRLWLLVWATLSCAALAWAALVLPWRPEAPLGLLLWGLAALHACVVVAAAWRAERLPGVLGLLGVTSGAAALTFAAAIGVTAVEMVQTFGRLGWAIAVALIAIGWLALLATLPAAFVCFRRRRALAARPGPGDA